MRKILSIYISVLCLAFIGCSMNGSDAPYDPTAEMLPRLIISGQITNTASENLPGIHVSVPSVCLPNERNALSYNYAIADSAGQYTIIRYRGRELPTELTVVATDSTGLYQEQSRICEITYDSVYVKNERRKIPYNGYVTADFVLSQ